MPPDPHSDFPQHQPRPAPQDRPALVPVLAPMKRGDSGERGGQRWFRLAALALAAAGLALAVAFKSDLKQAAHFSASRARAAFPKVGPAPAPQPTPERQGGGIAFKEAADSGGTLNPQVPQACANSWNEVHSGLDSGKTASEGGLTPSLRPVGAGQSPETSHFALPDDAAAGPRMGELPASWQQCRK